VNLRCINWKSSCSIPSNCPNRLRISPSSVGQSISSIYHWLCSLLAWISLVAGSALVFGSELVVGSTVATEPIESLRCGSKGAFINKVHYLMNMFFVTNSYSEHPIVATGSRTTYKVKYKTAPTKDLLR